MKAFFATVLVLSAASSAAIPDINNLISHEFKHFSLRHTPQSKLPQASSSRVVAQESNKLKGDVSGYKVKFFQYTNNIADDYNRTYTQFGTWYKNDVTNDTRTEIVTFSVFNKGNGDQEQTIPSEYLDISGTEYQILEADSQYVYCEAVTPAPKEDIEYEKLGYAFFVPKEEAYSIVWGPRLVQIYYDPTTSEDTVAYYGNDAFNGEPVVFAQYNTTYEQLFIWSLIKEEEITSNDFVVPTDLTCTQSSDSTQDNAPQHDRAVLDVIRQTRRN